MSNNTPEAQRPAAAGDKAEILETAGKAVGFVLALLLQRMRETGQAPTLDGFTHVLEQLAYDSEVFGPDAKQVALGMLEGVSVKQHGGLDARL